MTGKPNSVKRRQAQRGGAIGAAIRTIFILALIAIAAIAALAYYIQKEISSDGPLADDSVIWVKPGMGVTDIAAMLVEEGAIKREEYFLIATKVRSADTRLRAGEFEIPAGASVLDIVDTIVSGKIYMHLITFPEGLTTNMIMALINGNDVLEGEVTLAPAEGDLLPETYAFPRGDTRDELIQRMMDAHDEVLDLLWETRAEDLPFETKEEAVILASIVEKETAVAAERPLVASVFVNRLRRGMRLESDPTIIYGLTGGEPLGRGIRQSELRGETPYNTYVIRGLPPTPIANPGRASIAAVLNPADTDYIFFVADGTGGHAFASTLAEHNANVAKWRRIERERANAQ
ncbi:endolytic transglycosylase MltG [Parvularcula flava]|uniref:Endolytic murein transglycosylase n=1 Tax=Aquisalinus luteolus TaxID=1566827 RepID=A0ABX0HH81_9PROT|nr:endolytic transglycosylase MltG [Aquisalinus luteolus]